MALAQPIADVAKSKAGPLVEQGGKRRTPKPRPAVRPEDPASGDIAEQILELPAGGRVASASATVSGAAFHGRIANLQGARVTASPVIRSGEQSVPPTATEKAFIVDFGRSLSVLGLKLVKSGRISLVVPWLGIDFAPDPIYQQPLGPFQKTDSDDAVGLSGLETMKLLIQVTNSPAAEATFGAACVITTATLPSNVRASLNGRLPFWTQPGPLDRPVQLTGLAEDLNALLASAEGPVAVTLALTTDTPGVLELDFDADGGADIELTAQARWGGAQSTGVALAALEPQVVAVPFQTDSTATWNVRRLIADVSGAFPPWRAYPAQETAAGGALGLKIDATFSVARRLDVPADIELHGVALLLRASAAPAELHVELVAGTGAPPPGAKPLAAAELALSSAPAAGTAPAMWHELLFAAPVKLAAAAGAWLVVQAKTGTAEWVAAAEAARAGTTTLGSAQGGRWDRYPPVGGAVAVAHTRILRRPLATENAALLTLGWADGGGETLALDPGREVATIELSRPDADPLVTSPETGYVAELKLTAAATGTLTFERATTLYREKTP